MGKAYNGIGGSKYKNANKSSENKGARRSVKVTQSSRETMELVVRVTKKASDSETEYHHTFDLEELGINLETARLYKLFNKEGIYGRYYPVERCFTNSKYVDSSDEEEDEEDEEDEGKGESAEEEKRKEALDDWVDVAKEVKAVGELKEGTNGEEVDAEEESEEDEESEDEDDDDNPYMLIFEAKGEEVEGKVLTKNQDAKRKALPKYAGVNGNTLINDLFDGELIITLK
ncbi:hypothetical protein GGI20_005202 [Coemansia sp. BCRC 34301]|nr:hypothetical protein GGI20_005202 [Coemansia sp. BCRC 34301]